MMCCILYTYSILFRLVVRYRLWELFTRSKMDPALLLHYVKTYSLRKMRCGEHIFG